MRNERRRMEKEVLRKLGVVEEEEERAKSSLGDSSSKC